MVLRTQKINFYSTKELALHLEKYMYICMYVYSKVYKNFPFFYRHLHLTLFIPRAFDFNQFYMTTTFSLLHSLKHMLPDNLAKVLMKDMGAILCSSSSSAPSCIVLLLPQVVWHFFRFFIRSIFNFTWKCLELRQGCRRTVGEVQFKMKIF